MIADDTGEMVQLGRTSRKKDSDAESATSRGTTFALQANNLHRLMHYTSLKFQRLSCI